jgi:site-specific recombinase XerD
MARSNNSEAVRFARYIADFLYDYAPNMLTHSEHTLKSYKDALVLYVQFLESKGITPSEFSRACFERSQIEEWIRWLKEIRNSSPATCNVRLASIRVFLEYIAGLDISLAYLYQEAKLIKRQKCARKKVSGLTREAVAAMLEAPDPAAKIGKRDLVFMILMYATAARLDEMLSLKVKQIHVAVGSNPYVTIIGKGQKTRTMYLLPKAVAHIKKYMSEVHGDSPDPEAYLFYSRVGGKYKKLTEPAMDKRLKKHAISAHEKCPDVPLRIHAHRFRHAKASHWIEEGLNILQVSFLLDHAQLQTTMVYLDVTTEDKAAALATLESEQDKRVDKKWRNPNGTLSDYCGLAR